MARKSAPSDIPGDSDVERTQALIASGADLAARLIGGAVGAYAGGVGGALVGVTTGQLLSNTFVAVGADVHEQFLGPRQRMRMGGLLAVAQQRAEERFRGGATLRSDGFFEPETETRSSAEEVVEGALISARDAHEEAKLQFTASFVVSVAIDDRIDRVRANQYLRTLDSLSFSQLVLLALIAESADDPDGETLSFPDHLSLQVDELERLGLIGREGRGASTRRGGMTFVDAGGLSLTQLAPTAFGELLYEVSELSLLKPEHREHVRSQLVAQPADSDEEV